MSASILSVTSKYGASALIVVGAITLLLWPFIDQPSRRGVLTAALIALPSQVLAFAGLIKYRARPNGFMAAWAGGMAFRALVVVITAFVVVQTRAAAAVALLLSLAGFLFALLLLEAAFFRRAVSGGAAR